MKHFVIVDGHHLLYRAYWAIPRTMRTSFGEQVNTSFGIVSMLLMILRIEEPDRIVFCFDAGEETFRHVEYAEYKSGRADTPEDFHAQVPRALSVIDAFGIHSVSGMSYEADDFIASYARAGEREGDRVTIVSGDRDFLQLVSDRIRVAVPHKGYQAAEYFGPEDVRRKLGITPAQVSSYKGLVGDTSDNLAGVHGIGPKTAATLLQQYPSLEDLYAHLDDIKPSWRAKLTEGKEQAFFCKRLAELVTDITLPVGLDDLTFTRIPVVPIDAMMKELEFSLAQKRFHALLSTPYGQRCFIGADGSAPPPIVAAEKSPPVPQEAEQLSLL